MTDQIEKNFFSKEETHGTNPSIMPKNQNLILRSFIIGKDIPQGVTDLTTKYKSLNGDNIFEITEIFNSNFQKVGEIESLSFLQGIFDNSQGIWIEDYSVDRKKRGHNGF